MVAGSIWYFLQLKFHIIIFPGIPKVVLTFSWCVNSVFLGFQVIPGCPCIIDSFNICIYRSSDDGSLRVTILDDGFDIFLFHNTFILQIITSLRLFFH